LREEWREEVKRDIDKLLKQKWVPVIKEWPFLHSSCTIDFPWYYGCKRLKYC
jgi:hypothetical protein